MTYGDIPPKLVTTKLVTKYDIVIIDYVNIKIGFYYFPVTT